MVILEKGRSKHKRLSSGFKKGEKIQIDSVSNVSSMKTAHTIILYAHKTNVDFVSPLKIIMNGEKTNEIKIIHKRIIIHIRNILAI